MDETADKERPWWALPVVIVAIIAVAIAGYVAFHGLAQNPVGATDSGGVTTIRGDFEPYGCGNGCVEGFVEAGARSVFVIFPGTCAAPASGSAIVVRGKLDPTQGSATYRAVNCGTAA